MLGVRLPIEAEEMLERHARATGRAKSVLAREWIIEGLERKSIDAEMRRAAEAIASNTSPEEQAELEAMTDDWLRALDAEDGGYDWGPEGPPA
jgi:predicted DNA-binding protein